MHLLTVSVPLWVWSRLQKLVVSAALEAQDVEICSDNEIAGGDEVMITDAEVRYACCGVLEFRDWGGCRWR